MYNKRVENRAASPGKRKEKNMNRTQGIEKIEQRIKAEADRIAENYTGMMAIHQAEHLDEYLRGVNDTLEAIGSGYIITVTIDLDDINHRIAAFRHYIKEERMERI